LFEGKTLFAMAAMLLGVSLLAGCYPAFFMASISPVSALRNNVRTPRGRGVQKFSLACQYVVSAGLLICTAVLYQQMDFINAYDLGFRKENVMVLTLPTDTVSQQRVHALKVELGKHSEVSEVALTGLGAIPGQEPELGSITVKTNDGDDIRMVNQNYVDENYLPALEIRLVEGRNFDGRISDFQNSILVNESFVRMMGWEEPLEHKIQWNEKWKNVIGVVTDFHYSSLYHRVDPQVIVYHDNNVSNLFIVLPNTSMQQQIADLAETWRAFFPEEPFVYTFLDDSINAQYQKEERAVLLFTYFSVLTTVISCLGLFGLASLAVYQRKKEIGIRKIAGAGFSSLLILISKEYFRLILVALVVALPVSGLIMNQWLETFPYRGDMGIIVFIWVSAGVMVTALITIWVGISRISSTRPVDLVGEG
jgi:putative ABC transport system permease protein